MPARGGLLLSHFTECRGFHDAQAVEDINLIGIGNAQRPENHGQRAVIQACRACKSGAPLRLHEHERVLYGHVLGPQLDLFVGDVFRLQAEFGQGSLVRRRLIERLGRGNQFFRRPRMCAMLNSAKMAGTAPS